MTKSQTAVNETPPPHAQLVQMATAYWASQILYAAAKLNLADHLADGPKTAHELAGVRWKRVCFPCWALRWVHDREASVPKERPPRRQ